MTAENREALSANYEHSYQESYAKNKIRKSSRANDKSFAEFYIGLTLTMYFRIFGEQEFYDAK